jgi:hypothetical protein
MKAPLALALLLSTSGSAWSAVSGLSWSCGESKWDGRPKIVEGVFRARVVGDCSVEDAPRDAFPKLLEKFVELVKTSPRFTIHGGPWPEARDKVRGFRMDLTDNVAEEGTPLKIRQSMFIGTDGATRFVYETRSTAVEAEGRAAYLKKVSFFAELVRDESPLVVVSMANEVAVERPWYAFNFIFLPIGKDVTMEKFASVRDRLLDHFTRSFAATSASLSD